MRTFAIAAVVALAGCSSAASSSFAPILKSPVAPAIGTRNNTYKNGIYVAQFNASAVYGYLRKNQRNAPPICGESGLQFVADIGTDPQGNLMVPSQIGEYVYVYGGPRLCGKLSAKVQDPDGLPVDVASSDALAGTIAVANIEGNGPISNPPPGNISVCTVAQGCTADLNSRRMYRVAGVAIDKSGDCWASAVDKAGAATLTRFAGCSGKGIATTGFRNASYGGLEFDADGRLLAIDYSNRRVFVYTGCKPACKVVAGPFALHGQAIYGKLNAAGTVFAAADYLDARIDVYSYAGKSLKYQFSFSQGLTPSGSPEGVAFAPSI